MEKLHLTILIEPQGSMGGEKIQIGNTGLVVWRHAVDPANGHIDFTPEGNCDSMPGYEKQYALQFLGAMAEFIEWNQTASEPPIQHTQISTNPRMADFVTRNFGVGVSLVESNTFTAAIDLDIDALTYEPEIYDLLTSAQRQLLSANYYVEDPGI